MAWWLWHDMRCLLTVYILVKVQEDLQADNSSVVVKGPFFPRVMNPRCWIYGTNVWCKSSSSKAEKLRSSRGETYAYNLKTHKNESNLMKAGGSKRLRGIDKPILRDWIKPSLKFRTEEEVTSPISQKASLNHGFPSDSENARLLEPPFCHNAPLFVRVSLGRVQGEVEIFWKVRHAPLATTATRTSSVIYLEDRS
jgi:hypothetical protein